MIKYEDFALVDIRSGTLVKAEEFLRALNPAYKVWVNFGEEIGILQISAQITKNYTLDAVIGLKVMGCINIGEKNIGGFLYQFLLLGFADDNGNIVLPVIASNVLNGQKLF